MSRVQADRNEEKPRPVLVVSRVLSKPNLRLVPVKEHQTLQRLYKLFSNVEKGKVKNVTPLRLCLKQPLNASDIETAVPINILNKTVKEEVNDDSSNNCEEDTSSPKKRRRTKIPRVHRKPTTCYQCGAHFPTLTAYMEHHMAEHPGTCLRPPEDRPTCPICGISVAPCSLAAHINIHTRSNVYNCEVCDKEFLTKAAVKRHSVTHTGEKLFSCALCGRRFTQSNGVKLHYRTFHLKEPYPKRDRSNRKEPKKTYVRKKIVKEESDSDLLQQEMESVVEEMPDLEDDRYVYVIPSE